MNGTQKTKTDEANKEKKDKRSKLITKLTIAGAAAAVLLFAKFCPMKEEIARTSPQADQQTTCPETRPCPPCPLKPDAGVRKPDMKPAPDMLVKKPDAIATTLKPPKPPAPTVKRCDVNGKWERIPGKIMEECDPEAKPTGCNKPGQICTDKCKCKNPESTALGRCSAKDNDRKPADVDDYSKTARQVLTSSASLKFKMKNGTTADLDGLVLGVKIEYCRMRNPRAKVTLTGDDKEKLSDEAIKKLEAKISGMIQSLPLYTEDFSTAIKAKRVEK